MMKSLKQHTVILLLLLLAFGLRLWGLDTHSIWWDEGASTWLSRQPIAALLDWTARDTHPPLYFLLLRGWRGLVGEGEFVLRFPSVLIGTLGVVAIYGLGRALGGDRAGLLAALFLTLSRLDVTWSQEIRMYILAITLATAALWATVRLWQKGGWCPWIAYVLTVAGSLYTLYLTAPVPVIANLAFLLVWQRRGRPRPLLVRWVMAQMAVLILFFPWVQYALARASQHGESVYPFSWSFALQYYIVALTVGVETKPEAYTLPALAVFTVLMAGVYTIWASHRKPEQTAGLALLVLGLILSALLVFAIALPLDPRLARALTSRYFLALAGCFYTLLGWGLAMLLRRRPAVAGAGILVVSAVALTGLASFYPGRVRSDDYISIAAMLQAHRQPGDTVVLYTDKAWPVFAAHYAGDWQAIWNGMAWDEAAARERLRPLWQEAEAVWLVMTPDAQRADPNLAVQKWLTRHAVASVTWDFGDNLLALYARTPQRAQTLYNLNPDFIPPAQPTAELAAEAKLHGASLPLSVYPTAGVVYLSLYWEQPPQHGITLSLVGPTQRVLTYDPPPAATSGLTHQVIDLSLTPDLAGGRYQVYLQTGEGQGVKLGEFSLIHSAVEGAVTNPTISHRLNLRLGEAIELLGYDLATSAGRPGESIQLTLYWQAVSPVHARYKVLAALMGEQFNPKTGNPLWGQQDNEPVNWTTPTTYWAPGTVIADPHLIPIDPDTPAGAYTIVVAMYGLIDGVRLPVYGADGSNLGDSVSLQQFNVQPQP